MSLPASRVRRNMAGNIKRCPASFVSDVARIVRADRTARAPLFDRKRAGSGGSGVDWMIPPVQAGVRPLPLLCLEDNNYSAYSLRGQRIASAPMCVCVCVEDGRVAWRETG